MYTDILLAVDLEHDSSWIKALPTAVELCRASDARLHVLTVVPDFGMTIVGQYFPEGFEKDVSKKVLERLRAFVKEHVPDGPKVRRKRRPATALYFRKRRNSSITAA